MMENGRELEFDVLGFKIKFKSDENDQVPASEIVNLVWSESDQIRSKYPGISIEKVAILASLQLATKNLTLEREYRDNINGLETTVSDALGLIDSITPR